MVAHPDDGTVIMAIVAKAPAFRALAALKVRRTAVEPPGMAIGFRRGVTAWRIGRALTMVPRRLIPGCMFARRARVRGPR